MGEQPVRGRLLRAGSSGNVSLHQPQVSVFQRLCIKLPLSCRGESSIVWLLKNSFFYFSLQPLVNGRLRSLDNLLSGDDETPFHQPRGGDETVSHRFICPIRHQLVPFVRVIVCLSAHWVQLLGTRRTRRVLSHSVVHSSA